MKNKFALVNRVFLVILIFFLINSCKLEEFKWDELGIKEGWNTKLVVPVFYGDLEFKDFITDWYDYEDDYSFNDPQITLEYHEYHHKTIPQYLIFDRSVVIDSFPFLVQGNYELDSISLEFIVTNASPYPLNLELQFFNKYDNSSTTGPILPEPFDAGKITGNSIEPVKTIRYVNFTPSQNENFSSGNRVNFISWYNENNYQKDTLLAYYPIEVSILLHGVLKNKNEE